MSRIQWIRVLTLAIVLSLTACSDNGTPTEASPVGLSLRSAQSDAAHARHELLKQELEARKDAFHAIEAASRDSFRLARAEWKAWKEDWKEQAKAQKQAWKREHPGVQWGGLDIQLLRCEPRPYDADAAIIGPSGGTLHAGEHELVIPKGALDHEELIVMEAPTSSRVDVRLEPEGLQFQRPAALTLSYKGCVVPTIADLLVAYLGHGNQILELPPSSDFRNEDKVEADIGHFSRYAVAY